MNLTPEQEHIIRISKNLYKNEILAIQAYAGSGKTTILREIALENPSAKFLYLAFNKAIVCESKAKFPKNVEVRTIHSIAFEYAKKKLGNFRPINKLNRFDLEEIIEFENNKIASDIIRLFDEFLKSDKTLEDSLPNKSIIEYLYESTLEQKIPITHNFYLKFYQLSKDKHLNYDFVLLDEAQDSNAAMISVFLDNDCKKILVGDSLQNIYGFNHSINAFEVIKANYYATLSQSFRCNQNILNYANFMVNKFTNKSFINMTSSHIISNDKNNNKAFITRTNAGIIKLIYSLENPQDFCLLKEPNKIFAPIWSILHFRNAKFSMIPREYAYLKHIKNNKALYAYIANSNDLELQNAMKLLEYDIDLVKIMQLANSLYNNKKAQNFILNAHQAKGLEWDSVEICDDFPSLLALQKMAKDSPEMIKILEQELHLFYVAITRAKRELIDNSQNYLIYNSHKK